MNEQQQGPRNTYQIKIPKNATPEEIKAFMKEFMKNWGKDKEDSTEQPSTPD